MTLLFLLFLLSLVISRLLPQSSSFWKALPSAFIYFLPIIEHGCCNKLQDNPVEHFLYLLEGLRPREVASLGTWSRLVHFQCIFVKVKQSLLGPNIAPVTQESRWNARVCSSVIDPTSPDLSIPQQGYPYSCLNLVC